MEAVGDFARRWAALCGSAAAPTSTPACGTVSEVPASPRPYSKTGKADPPLATAFVSTPVVLPRRAAIAALSTETTIPAIDTAIFSMSSGRKVDAGRLPSLAAPVPTTPLASNTNPGPDSDQPGQVAAYQNPALGLPGSPYPLYPSACCKDDDASPGDPRTRTVQPDSDQSPCQSHWDASGPGLNTSFPVEWPGDVMADGGSDGWDCALAAGPPGAEGLPASIWPWPPGDACRKRRRADRASAGVSRASESYSGVKVGGSRATPGWPDASGGFQVGGGVDKVGSGGGGASDHMSSGPGASGPYEPPPPPPPPATSGPPPLRVILNAGQRVDRLLLRLHRTRPAPPAVAAAASPFQLCDIGGFPQELLLG
jgi:uncharacterized membrane protein YgcG